MAGRAEFQKKSKKQCWVSNPDLCITRWIAYPVLTGRTESPQKKSKDSPGIRTRVSALSGKRAYHSATETQKILVKIYYQMCASKAVDLNKKYAYDNMSLP